jgi:hypothetical protein
MAWASASAPTQSPWWNEGSGKHGSHFDIQRLAVIIDGDACIWLIMLCSEWGSSMKGIVSTLILSSLLVSSVHAQDQESPREKLHRDFPNVQLIRPSFPPWRFNFESKTWERDESPAELPEDPIDLTENLRLLSGLPLLSKPKPKRIRHMRTRHHIHRKPPRP